MRCALCALALLVWSGCTTQVRQETRYTITQQALLPAPAGPDSVGVMAPEGKFTAQGGAQVTYVRVGESAKQRAELGHLLMNRTFHGRISYGISDKLELGFGGFYGNSEWAQSSSDMQPESTLDRELLHLFWGGAQLRGAVIGDRLNGIGLLGEVSAGRVPFTRHVHEETTTYTTSSVNGVELLNTTSMSEDQYTEEAEEIHLIWRGGVQGAFSLGQFITFQGGALMQGYPRYWARRVTGRTCEDNLYDGQPASCNGDTPNTINSHNQIHFGTLFAGASVGGDGIMSLHGQIYTHAIAPDVIQHVSPVGVDLRLRLTF